MGAGDALGGRKFVGLPQLAECTAGVCPESPVFPRQSSERQRGLLKIRLVKVKEG